MHAHRSNVCFRVFLGVLSKLLFHRLAELGTFLDVLMCHFVFYAYTRDKNDEVRVTIPELRRIVALAVWSFGWFGWTCPDLAAPPLVLGVAAPEVERLPLVCLHPQVGTVKMTYAP